jgi:glycosyltransferase involved in cell wall biosynthesis
MKVCLLTSDGRHTPAGERIAALAARLDDASVIVAGAVDDPGTTHIDELGGSFDAAVAFGWRACLHVFRVEADRYAYAVPALEDAQLWHGDEKRLLAALTYDLPLTLIAPSEALATELRDRAPGRRVVVVERGYAPAAAGTGAPDDGSALRIVTSGHADEILARASEPIQHVAAVAGAAVALEVAAPGSPLALAPVAMQHGAVPVVTPVEGHDELVADGESGLVVGFDDVPGAARALDTLARDRELLARLRDGALRRAAALPTVEAETAALLEALSAAPAATDRPERLLLNARAVAEPIAQERRALDLALRSYEDRIEALTGENDRLRTELDAARRGLLERIRRRV